jgi:hypothetical protein
MKQLRVYELIKTSGIFFLKHPSIITVASMLGLFGWSMCVLCALGYAVVAVSVIGKYTLIGCLAFSLPLIKTWQEYVFLWCYLWAAVLMVLHARVTFTRYLLAKIRSQPVSVLGALIQSCFILQRAWRVVLFYLAWIVTIVTGEIYLYYNSSAHAQWLMGAGAVVLWFLLVLGYFAEQLVADGEMRLLRVWKHSLQLLKQCLFSALVITLFLAAGLWLAWWSGNLFVQGLVALITLSLHAVMKNKLYQIVSNK